jgi:hypothetical protein
MAFALWGNRSGNNQKAHQGALFPWKPSPICPGADNATHGHPNALGEAVVNGATAAF